MIPQISASIVLYKSDNQVKTTIENFLNTDLPVQLFLVDNSPTNQLQSELRDLLDDHRITYIFNNVNLGFGAAHNIAIRKAIHVSPYHLVLNPDISFGPGVLEELVNYLDRNEEVGMAIPKVYYADGRLQYVCKLLPSPFDLIGRRFLPAAFMRRRMERFELRQMEYDRPFEAPYIHGCFMFIRMKAIKKIGFFDERFFMYPEDIDLTRRINKEYRTMFYPKVSVMHAHQKGSYKNIGLLLIHVKNMIKYFNKWGWFFDSDRKRINRKILTQVQS